MGKANSEGDHAVSRDIASNVGTSWQHGTFCRSSCSLYAQLSSLETLRCWTSFHYSRPPGDRQRDATRVLLSGNVLPVRVTADGLRPRLSPPGSLTHTGEARGAEHALAELGEEMSSQEFPRTRGHRSFEETFVKPE